MGQKPDYIRKRKKEENRRGTRDKKERACMQESYEERRMKIETKWVGNQIT